MTTQPFIRSAVPPKGPAVTSGKVLVEAPIVAPVPPQRSVWAIVLPTALVVGVVGMLVLMFSSGMRQIGYGGFFGGFMMFGMVGMMLRGMRGKGGAQPMPGPELNQLQRKWFSRQDDNREVVDAARRQQWDQRTFFHWDPKRLVAVPGSQRMWDRPPGHEEFLVVRIGTGKVALQKQLEPDKAVEPVNMEPATGHALRRFLIEQSHIEDMPKTIWLQRYPGLSVVGEMDSVRAVVRAMLCQIAAFHSPADVQIFIVTTNRAAWEWCKWLPHLQHPVVRDGCGERRMVFSSAVELEEFFDATSDMDRGPWTPPASALTVSGAQPFRIIVDDHCGNAEQWSGLTGSAGYDGTCFIRLAPQVPDAPAQAILPTGAPAMWVGFDPATTYRLSESGDLHKKSPMDQAPVGGAARQSDELDAVFYARADSLGVDDALRVARGFARWRAPDAHATVATTGESERATLFQALGIRDPATTDFERLWSARRPRPGNRAWMTFPVGTDDAGMVTSLDLKEGAQGGMGMHSIFIGTTGAGKSEGLIAEVCSLAATHSPEVVNIVFMDFKLKSAAGVIERFAHTLAAVSNLQAEQHLIGRMYEALHGELELRGEAIAALDDCPDLTVYNEKRLTDPTLPPIPALYIIIDEYNEVLNHPEYGTKFRDLFLRIVRLGRSLHMFLQLVGQNLDVQHLRNIEKMLGFRIVGRVNEEESQTALKSKAAAYIAETGAEGTAYLRVATSEPRRFRYFYCSGPFVAPVDGEDGVAAPVAAGTWFSPRVFTLDAAEDADGLLAAPPVAELEAAPVVVAPVAEPVKMHQALAAAVSRTGVRPPRQLWLPPLPRLNARGQWTAPLPTVDAMVEQYRGKPWYVDYGDNEGLRFPLALEDDPRQHTQFPYVLDLTRQNAMVAAAPQRGATTTLMSLVVSGALMYRPERVQFYCIAASGPQLASIADIPHVAGVVAISDTEGVGRLIATVRAIATERERAFALRGLDMDMVREAKFGPNPTDIGIDGGDVVLVIDGWSNFSKQAENLVPVVESLLRSRNYGIRVVYSHVSTYRQLTSAVQSETAAHMELSLGEALESKIPKRSQSSGMPAKEIPEMPGRGMSMAANHFMVASPVAHAQDGQIVGTREVGALIRDVAGVTGQAELLRLPESVSVDDVLADARDADPRADRLPIGLLESTLGPAFLDLSDNPNVVAVGRSKSGRTNFLRTVCRAITDRYSPEEAWIVVIDPKRTLLGAVPDEYLSYYAYAPESVRDLVNGPLTEVFNDRQPPSGTSQYDLLTKTFWEGRQLFIVVDDATAWSAMNSPLAGMVPMIPLAAAVGFHFILAAEIQQFAYQGAHTPTGAIVQSLAPVVILDGGREHGKIAHDQYATTQRPGKGILAATSGSEGVLVAWTEPAAPQRR